MNAHHYHNTYVQIILKLMCVRVYVWHREVLFDYLLHAQYWKRFTTIHIMYPHRINYHVWACVVAESVLMDL